MQCEEETNAITDHREAIAHVIANEAVEFKIVCPMDVTMYKVSDRSYDQERATCRTAPMARKHAWCPSILIVPEFAAPNLILSPVSPSRPL